MIGFISIDSWLYTKDFKKRKSGHKPRVVHKSSSALGFFDKLLVRSLRKSFPKARRLKRITQHLNDLSWIDDYKYLVHIDIRKCYDSANVSSFLRYFAKDLSFFQKLLIKVIYNSDTKSNYPKKKLRAGLSSSSQIIEIIMYEINALKEDEDLKIQYFIDDIAVYGNDEHKIQQYLFKLRKYLSIFGLSLHDQVGPKFSGIKETHLDGQLSGRLGLLFNRNNGKLTTKLRYQTKRRYLLRTRKILRKSHSFEYALKSIHTLFRGSENSFGLFQAFPKEVWTNRLDRQLFFKSTFKEIKRVYPMECRNFDLNIVLTEGMVI